MNPLTLEWVRKAKAPGGTMAEQDGSQAGRRLCFCRSLAPSCFRASLFLSVSAGQRLVAASSSPSTNQTVTFANSG